MDTYGNIEVTIKDKERALNRNNVAGSVALYKNNGIYYIGRGKEQLYHLSEKYNKELYGLFYLKNEVEWKELIVTPETIRDLSDYLSITYILEDENLFYITAKLGYDYSDQHSFKKFIFKKKSKEIIPTNGFQDDINNGIMFWPKFKEGNSLVCPYQAYEILDNYKVIKEHNIKVSPSYQALADSIEIADNPIIAIAQVP